MVVIEGDAVGQIVLRGPGAGEGPTASAVMGDVCDIARGITRAGLRPARGHAGPRPARQRRKPAPVSTCGLALIDKPGALAKVATVLGENGISIDRMRQYDHPGADAPVLIVTHKTARPNLDTALAALPGTGVVAGDAGGPQDRGRLTNERLQKNRRDRFPHANAGVSGPGIAGNSAPSCPC
jgi:homoserine dehydrogenase